jgi:hypothetical protein
MTKIQWHHRITHFPHVQLNGYIDYCDQIGDFCAYTRWFLWKLLIVIPVTCLFIGWVLGEYLAAWVVLFTVHGGLPNSDFLHASGMWVMVNFIVIALGVALGGLHLIYARKEAKEKTFNEDYAVWFNSGSEGIAPTMYKPDGFLTLWYRKWKIKYCPKMEY